MGNRNNIIVHQPSYVGEDLPPLYLYSHWTGSELVKVVANAIEKTDSQQIGTPDTFTRILFCEMIKNDVDGDRGFGISVGFPPDQDSENIPIHIHWDTSSTENKVGWIVEFPLVIKYGGLEFTAEQFVEAGRKGNFIGGPLNV
tara:strand:- start:3387 stop:3815 length:429 start_codon:yes stop_codon:yes gene_type:complete